jgi:hypothetical protein
MLTGPAAARLTLTFQQRIATIGLKAAKLVAATWDGLAGYDEEDIAAYTSRTSAAMAAAKAASVQAGVGYYSTLVQFRPPSVNPREVPIEVDPREPFIAYWNALKGGHGLEAALESGNARAQATARNLATSASRQAGDTALRKARLEVDGWSRNTDSGACEWCRGLTQFVWDTAAEADFGHDRCNCSVEPVIAVASLAA